jgi:salicylate hydroxylase
MTPYMAAGAGQAMEVRVIIQAQDYFNSYTKDAFVLGRLLSHPLATLDNVSAALKAYQDVRLPDAQLIARKSKRAGDFVQFNEPGYYDGTDKGNAREELQILAEVMTDNLESQYQNGAIVGWKRAERILQESVGLCNDCYKDASLFLPYNDLDS